LYICDNYVRNRITLPLENQYVAAWHGSGNTVSMEKVLDSLKDKIREIEREEIVNALRDCNWVMAKAARKLGISERMIGYKIKKYGLRIKEVRWIEDE
jgi:transcriptional regulator with GAF, ATPase, and Fis domain